MAIAFPDLQVLHDSGALYAALSQLLLQEGVAERLGDQFDWRVIAAIRPNPTRYWSRLSD